MSTNTRIRVATFFIAVAVAFAGWFALNGATSYADGGKEGSRFDKKDHGCSRDCGFNDNHKVRFDDRKDDRRDHGNKDGGCGRGFIGNVANCPGGGKHDRDSKHEIDFKHDRDDKHDHDSLDTCDRSIVPLPAGCWVYRVN